MNIEQALSQYGDFAIQRMTEALNDHGSIDFYKSMKKSVSGNVLEISMPIAGFYIDGGRGANKTPPPADALLSWLDRVAIPHEARFAVAKHIGKHGIPPKPFLDEFEKNLSVFEDFVYVAMKEDLITLVTKFEREN